MLSVIMPAKCLDKSCVPSIESILNQGIELELVIVVDGGGVVIDKDMGPRVNVVELTTNIGPAAAVNLG